MLPRKFMLCSFAQGFHAHACKKGSSHNSFGLSLSREHFWMHPNEYLKTKNYLYLLYEIYLYNSLVPPIRLCIFVLLLIPFPFPLFLIRFIFSLSTFSAIITMFLYNTLI